MLPPVTLLESSLGVESAPFHAFELLCATIRGDVTRSIQDVFFTFYLATQPRTKMIARQGTSPFMVVVYCGTKKRRKADEEQTAFCVNNRDSGLSSSIFYCVNMETSTRTEMKEGR